MHSFYFGIAFLLNQYKFDFWGKIYVLAWKNYIYISYDTSSGILSEFLDRIIQLSHDSSKEIYSTRLSLYLTPASRQKSTMDPIATRGLFRFNKEKERAFRIARTSVRPRDEYLRGSSSCRPGMLECAYNRLRQTLYTSPRISATAPPLDPFESYPLTMSVSRSLCKKVTVRHTYPPSDIDPLYDPRQKPLA